MKLKKIKFYNHKILNNLEVDFCDNNGMPLNTIVLIGENGTGKTILLKSVIEFINVDERDFKREEFSGLIENKNVLELLEKDLYETDKFKDNFEYLRKYLGDLDKDVMLINLEISRRKRTKSILSIL